MGGGRRQHYRLSYLNEVGFALAACWWIMFLFSLLKLIYDFEANKKKKQAENPAILSRIINNNGIYWIKNQQQLFKCIKYANNDKKFKMKMCISEPNLLTITKTASHSECAILWTVSDHKQN